VVKDNAQQDHFTEEFTEPLAAVPVDMTMNCAASVSLLEFGHVKKTS